MESDWSGNSQNQDMEDLRQGTHRDQLAVFWEQDPYDVDAEQSMHFLDLYFDHAGRATYCIFPRQPFLAWVRNNREKNQDHRMLLYSILAMGSVFTTDADKRRIGKHFAAVAAYAIEKRLGKFSLQLCQSRLLLGLYYFARDRFDESWDLCGGALRALSALRLNTEEGVKSLPDLLPELDYGFDRPTFEECCRRTFWSGFLMDVSSVGSISTLPLHLTPQQRYNGFCGGTLFIINVEDIYLRLPCLESSYESGVPVDSPLFDMDLLDSTLR